MRIIENIQPILDVPPSPQAALVQLHLHGELDLSSTAGLDSVFAGVEAGAPGGLVVDLSLVTFIDSSGLGCVVRAADRARAAGRAFTLVHPSASVARLISLMEVSDLVVTPARVPALRLVP